MERNSLHCHGQKRTLVSSLLSCSRHHRQLHFTQPVGRHRCGEFSESSKHLTRLTRLFVFNARLNSVDRGKRRRTIEMRLLNNNKQAKRRIESIRQDAFLTDRTIRSSSFHQRTGRPWIHISLLTIMDYFVHWPRFRRFLQSLLEHRAFDWTINSFILLNCLQLAIERPSISRLSLVGTRLCLQVFRTKKIFLLSLLRSEQFSIITIMHSLCYSLLK